MLKYAFYLHFTDPENTQLKISTNLSQVTINRPNDLNMSGLLPSVRASTLLRATTFPRSLPPLTPHRFASGTSDWSGRQGHEHVTNRKDELDVQSGASQSGKRERAADNDNASQGTSEKDSGNQNEQAKKDHPEAPGPVIGMNDERGEVSFRPSNIESRAVRWLRELC